jgi:glycosyltransferase involved in cell wall biosynthesis
MKIILSAYGCHPSKGSEAGVGWNWLRELSKYNEVYVLFYSGQGQREAVEGAASLLPQRANIHLIPIDVPRFFQNRLYRIRYEIWQIKAYIEAKKIIKRYKIDLIHQVTIAAWWFSGYYYLLNTKLIWGPISGGQYIPLKALPFLRIGDKVYETIRTILTRTMIKMSISAQMNFKKASIVLAANEVSLKLFNRFRANKDCVLTSDTGIQKNALYSKAFKNQNNKIKLLWSGLLIPRKNFGLLFESLKLMPKNIDWELIVAGEGKLLRYWKQKVNDSKVGDRIKFLGNIPFNEMQDLYKKVDIFVFPSLREGFPTVLIEAMAKSLPIIAMDLYGTQHFIGNNCGILIPVKNKTQMINDFRDAIIKLCENPELRYEMGENARKRVEEYFLWEKRGKMMNDIYKQIFNKEIH